MSASATLAVISIMFGLIVKDALEAAFKPIFQENSSWHSVSGLAWFQLVVFFVLMLRFYLGALRFVEMERKSVVAIVRGINLFFAFVLFCNFYLIGLSVVHPEHFYTLVIAIHVVDLAWFILSLVFSFTDAVAERVGEIKKAAVRKLIIFFLILDVVTLSCAGLVYLVIFNKGSVAGNWAFLAAIALISLFAPAYRISVI
jgi:hypothetical protein